MLVLDAHVHVYPFYDEGVLLSTAVERLSKLASPEDQIGIVLVEREGVDVFGKWESGKVPEGWSMKSLDACALQLKSGNGRPLLVFAGRQIACHERLEILGLGVRTGVRDGLECATAIYGVGEDGGLAMLSWGVGKWLFPRSLVIKRLMRDFMAIELGVCDTSLRPWFWPLGGSVLRGMRPFVCGSDPLPYPGEEKQAGRYACKMDFEWPTKEPTKAMLSAVACGMAKAVGSRNSFKEFLRRR